MRRDYIQCLGAGGFHRMHYVEWGEAGSQPIVVCVHGLTRNGRDFDVLAQALEQDFHVVCPDIVGRGLSDWLPNKDGYSYPQYCADLAALIARVTAGRADTAVCWVGTSMGGILGMILAAAKGSPISKLVLNDVGALITKTALERISAYVGKDPRFATRRELENYLRWICAPFGPLTDAQWQHLAEHSALEHEDGSWGMRYDPGIAAPFRQGPIADVNLWQYYDAIACPALLLRGAQTDLLARDTALEMTQRGPRARLVEFEGVGHAPMLMAGDQIAAVRDFLLQV